MATNPTKGAFGPSKVHLARARGMAVERTSRVTVEIRKRASALASLGQRFQARSGEQAQAMQGKQQARAQP